MTKAEELKLLEKIEGLIDSADEDSYIRMTFDGIGAVCMENIRADFGNCPVRDLDELREQFRAEVIRHDETKHQLADAQKMCKEALDENERLRKLVAEWEQNAHDAGDLYCELEKECAEKDKTISKLKAEIVQFRVQRMTEKEMSDLYDWITEED